MHDLIKEEITAHQRIIFNGNGYDDAWIEEAEKRGLSNLRTLPDAVKHYMDDKNVTLFTSHKVYSEIEMQSRHEVFLEKYTKLIDIEAKTMLEMAKQDILPAVNAYSSELASSTENVFAQETLDEITADLTSAYGSYKALKAAVEKSDEIEDLVEKADFFKDEIIKDMTELRASCDKLEEETAAEYWPFPTYGDLLFAVR